MKAILLCHLLNVGAVSRNTAVALELSIGRLTNRADIVTIGDHLHCYEIKTKRDNLHRLDRQIEAYQAVADHVTVVAASKHINAVLSRVPSNVGVIELFEIDGKVELRTIQLSSKSPFWLQTAALDLLPVSEIRSRLLTDHGRMKRDDLIEIVASLDSDDIRKAVKDFLHHRYSPTTRNFIKSVRRKAVKPANLLALKLWKRERATAVAGRQDITLPCNCSCDRDVYTHVGQSFGPVPDDIQSLLNFNQPTARQLNRCHHH